MRLPDKPAEEEISVAVSAATAFLAETLRPMLLHHIQCDTPRIPELRLELPSFMFSDDRDRSVIELLMNCADDLCVLPSTKQDKSSPITEKHNEIHHLPAVYM